MNLRIAFDLVKVKLRFLRWLRWDGRSSKALIDSAAPCHDAEVVGSYPVLNPLRLTVLAAEDFTSAPQNFQGVCYNLVSNVFWSLGICFPFCLQFFIKLESKRGHFSDEAW